MRLTSQFWVGAYIRRCHIEGAYALIQRRGSPEAGAIFVVLDRLDGSCSLYGAAPQALVPEASPADRLFVEIEGLNDPLAIQERLNREIRFDSDLWIVAVEDRQGRHFLELAPL